MPTTDSDAGHSPEDIGALRKSRLEQEHSLNCASREQEFRRRMALLEQALGVPEASSANPPDTLLEQVAEAVKSVHEQGFAIVPNALAADQVERLRHSLEPFFTTIGEHFQAMGGGPGGQSLHVHNVLAKTRSVDWVATLPLLRACIAAILGPDALFHAGAVVMAPDPGCDPQGIHRDDASFAALPRPRMPLVITAAFALDDYCRENGATHVAPGSCWWERERRPGPDEMIQCEMPAGSLLLWDGAIFHAGGANVTQKQSRRTLTFNYTRGWLRTQSNQFLAIPREVVLSLPPELQRDLGYEQSARGLGTVDGVHPLDYLRMITEGGGDGVQAGLGPEMRES